MARMDDSTLKAVCEAKLNNALGWLAGGSRATGSSRSNIIAATSTAMSRRAAPRS